jgi:hypothetical protein
MKTGMQIIGDWKKEIGVPLHELLQVLTEVTGRSGAEACKYALIGMAQSARALTSQSKSKRPVERDTEHGGAEYVNIFHKGKESRFYRFHFMRDADVEGTWEQAQQIKNKGLAKRSWMWGLRDLQAAAAASSRPISGVADVRTILGEKSCGYILTNRLSYLIKILPAGWEQSVVRAAGNKIMANVARQMERQWAREVTRARRGGSAIGRSLASYFVRA